MMVHRAGMMLAICLSACAPVAPTGFGSDQDRAETVFVTSTDGTLVHSASGLRFPKEINGFQRTDANVFGASGDYIGVQYLKELSSASQIDLRVATVNIGGMSPQAHYMARKSVVINSLSDGKTVEEGRFSRTPGLDGYGGMFSGDREGIDVLVGLWAFERGQWDLRVRVDVPTEHRLETKEAVGAFVKEMNRVNGSV